MTRVKSPDGLVTDVAASLARLVVGDGDRGFSYVDEPVPAGDEVADGPVEPKSNSPKAVWLAWAEHLGIEVPQGTKLPELKALVADFRPAPPNDEGITAVATVPGADPDDDTDPQED